MTASQVKYEMLKHFSYGGYFATFTEAFNNSDVLTLKRSMYTVEVEVKVSRYDLANELKAIRTALKYDLFKDSKVSSTKYYKHERYLLPIERKKTIARGGFIPNEFYFAVPEELEIQAKEILYDLDLPYGLYVVDKHNRWDSVVRHIDAKKLHRDKIDETWLLRLVSKASNEVLSTRKKLMEMESNASSNS